MPRSWLTPASEVHKSALPLRMALAFALGVKVSLKAPASIGTQLDPLLPARRYCFQLIAGGTETKRSAAELALVPP